MSKRLQDLKLSPRIEPEKRFLNAFECLQFPMFPVAHLFVALISAKSPNCTSWELRLYIGRGCARLGIASAGAVEAAEKNLGFANRSAKCSRSRMFMRSTYIHIIIVQSKLLTTKVARPKETPYNFYDSK